MSVLVWALATTKTEPPCPPSPPLGPPRGTRISRRNARQPRPPCPASTWTSTSSTNIKNRRSQVVNRRVGEFVDERQNAMRHFANSPIHEFTRSRIHSVSVRQDADHAALCAVILEPDAAGDLREDGVVFTEPRVEA